MKKLIFLTSILVLTSFTSYSQLKEGDNLLGPSLGFWPYSNVPTFGANFESQLTQAGIGTIGLGGVFRYTYYRYNYPYEYPPYNPNYDYNYYTFGLQCNYNFNEIGSGKFVPFLGLVLGYNSVSVNYPNPPGPVVYNSGFWIWGQFGTRYFFSNHVAGSLRFGFGNFNFDDIELGLDFKL